MSAYRQLSYTQFFFLTLCLVGGCAVRPGSETTSTNIEPTTADVVEKTDAPDPVEKIDERAVCPTDDDVDNLIDEMKKLQTSAHLLCTQKDKISTEALKMRIDEWNVKTNSTLSNCSLLVSAHGVETNSEIPLALDALFRSEKYLVKSLKAHELKNDATAKIFFAFAQDNLRHAEKISHMHNHWSRAKPLAVPKSLTKYENWLKEAHN